MVCHRRTAGVVIGDTADMMDVLLLAALAFPADIAARNAERDVQLKPFLQEIGFETTKALAAEELVRVAAPLACEPIRGGIPIRCGTQLPTSDPALCWNGVVVAAVNQRLLQMETNDTEDSALRFSCGVELISGRMTGRRRADGRFTTTITLERQSDKRSSTATLEWQPVRLPDHHPVLHERRLDRLRRPIELARAEYVAVLQKGGTVDVLDTTPLECDRVRMVLLAEKPFAGDDTWRKGVLAWIDAVLDDHRRGPTRELGRRLALSGAEQEALERSLVGTAVTAATPLSALPMPALLKRWHAAHRERDAALTVALQGFRAAHPFIPADQ